MDHQCRSRDLIIFGECVFLYVYHVSFLCVPCLIPTWAMTLSYVYHDSFLCVTWIICMCTMTHIYVHHDSWTICVVPETWSTSKKNEHLYAGTHICVCALSFNDSHLCIQWLTFLSMTYFFMCVMTHIYQLNASWTRVLNTWFPNNKHEYLKEEKEQFICPCIGAHTHSHTHTHTHTHTHIYMYIHSAYCKSNQNRTE